MKRAILAAALAGAAVIATPVQAQFDRGNEKKKQEQKKQGKSPVKRQNTPEKQAAQKKGDGKKKPFIERKKD